MAQKKEKKPKVVFANGIFDLLHPGHIELLKFAKSLGDKLVVGLNSDRSTKELKGEERPIHSELHRKIVLENLRYVDEVIIFDGLRPTALIHELMPDIVVKGNEYLVEDIRKTDDIPDSIEVVVCSLIRDEQGEKLSTTSTVTKLKGAL